MDVNACPHSATCHVICAECPELDMVVDRCVSGFSDTQTPQQRFIKRLIEKYSLDTRKARNCFTLAQIERLHVDELYKIKLLLEPNFFKDTLMGFTLMDIYVDGGEYEF